MSHPEEGRESANRLEKTKMIRFTLVVLVLFVLSVWAALVDSPSRNPSGLFVAIIMMITCVLVEVRAVVVYRRRVRTQVKQ